MEQSLVYLNGEMTPLSEARISVLDRGFIFGDGVYEVVPLYGRKLFCAEYHLQRLFRNLAKIEISNPHDEAQWRALIDAVISAHPAEDQIVYIHVTRGVAKRAHAFPKQALAPTVFIMTNPLVLPPAQMRANGVACISMEDQRWLRCDIKSISLLGNVLAAQYAAQHDMTETIQFREGYLTEASSSNVWVVKNGTLMAPPRDHLILEGVRYRLIEQFCEAEAIPFEARLIQRNEVFEADEVLLSSATKEVLPVVAIDGRVIGAGKPGAIYHQLYAAYQRAKEVGFL